MARGGPLRHGRRLHCPLGDSMAPNPGEDSRARIESWVHYLRSLAEEVQDDPELAAGLARQIRRAEDELAALAQGEAASRRTLRELQEEREKGAGLPFVSGTEVAVTA